jgi:hypothetical protein
LAFILICILLFLLTKLPSAQDLAKVINSKISLSNDKQSVTSTETKAASNQSTVGPEEDSKTIANINYARAEFNRIRRVMWNMFENDLANPNQPLVNVCNFLSNGEKVKF